MHRTTRKCAMRNMEHATPAHVDYGERMQTLPVFRAHPMRADVRACMSASTWMCVCTRSNPVHAFVREHRRLLSKAFARLDERGQLFRQAPQVCIDVRDLSSRWLASGAATGSTRSPYLATHFAHALHALNERAVVVVRNLLEPLLKFGMDRP